jgi:hypothetical protein
MSQTAEQYQTALIDLLRNFDASCPDLREKVLALVPAWDLLNGLGTSMIPHDIARSGRARLLHCGKNSGGTSQAVLPLKKCSLKESLPPGMICRTVHK